MLPSAKKRSVRYDFQMLYKIARLGGQLSPLILPTFIVQALIEAFFPFINIIFPAMLLSELAGEQNTQALIIIVSCIVGLNLLFTMVRAFLARRIEAYVVEMDSLLALKISEKTMSLDFEHMEDEDVQNKHQKVIDARQWVPSRIESQMKLFGDVLKSVVQLVTSLSLVAGMLIKPSVGGLSGLAAFIDSPLAFVALLALLAFNLLINAKAVERQAHFWNLTSKASVTNQRRSLYYWYLFDDYRLGKDIRLYDFADLLEDDIRYSQNQSLENTRRYMYRMPLPYSSATGSFSALSSGAIYLFVALKALLGSIALGEALLYIGAINQFATSMNNLSGYFTTVRSLTPFSEHYFNYLELEPIKIPGCRLLEVNGQHNWEIEFCDVSFGYPGQDLPVLQNVSVKLKYGERIAVVGRNGAGKTTFIKLLCRLYDPTEGKILLNGVDIREYDLDTYFELFSVVFQDFKLFAYPIGENLSASFNYDTDRAWSSLRDADVIERVERMPKGLEQYLYKNISPEGIDISGGEAQKIAIARSLYKDGPFVIFDEPTAALDPISEYEIYSNLDTLVGQKAAIFISHRLSSCQFCHDILVFEKGRIKQRGNHESLLKDNTGLYATMWRAQAQYYQDESE